MPDGPIRCHHLRFVPHGTLLLVLPETLEMTVM